MAAGSRRMPILLLKWRCCRKNGNRALLLSCYIYITAVFNNQILNSGLLQAETDEFGDRPGNGGHGPDIGGQPRPMSISCTAWGAESSRGKGFRLSTNSAFFLMYPSICRRTSATRRSASSSTLTGARMCRSVSTILTKEETSPDCSRVR